MRFDHIMIHTINTDESIVFYSRIFDMELVSTDIYETFDLNYMINRETNIKFELRNVFKQGKQQHGNVVGHFAFYHNDVDSIVKKLDLYYPHLFKRVEIHESKVHDKQYKILTVISPEGLEMSVLEKTRN